jgi:hypothetical protein
VKLTVDIEVLFYNHLVFKQIYLSAGQNRLYISIPQLGKNKYCINMK